MHNVQDYSVLYKDSVRWLFARTGILLTFGKHVHDCIISLRGLIKLAAVYSSA